MHINRLGAYCLLLATPLFLAGNVVTGLAWQRPPYSWATNNISDLGNVTCGVWDSTRPRLVCSPWHAVMNTAMVATGVLLALGLILTWSALAGGVATRAAHALTLAGAAGYILAGMYPADVDENIHLLAALLIFVLANLAMLVGSLARPPSLLGSMRAASVVLGVTGVVGTALFLGQVEMGFGVGGMERVAVCPLLIWTLAIALRLIRGDRP